MQVNGKKGVREFVFDFFYLQNLTTIKKTRNGSNFASLVVSAVFLNYREVVENTGLILYYNSDKKKEILEAGF